MDCAECTQHVQHALAGLNGVQKVDVFLASEKAVLLLDTNTVTMPMIREAVRGAGYSVPEADSIPADSSPTSHQIGDFTRPVLTLFGVVFGLVVFVAVVGEWLGLFEQMTLRVPWFVWLAAILVGGLPIFVNVVRAALKRQVLSHTLMSLGVLAAIAVGEWATALVVVFFMRVGDYAEKFTTERARRAVHDLTAMAPQTARVEREGREDEVPVSQVQVGQVVIVRPGDKIPVDGVVLSGQATVDQSAITGESMPVEAATGTRVYAASIAKLGSLRVQTTHRGADTTFGRIIKMVEEAEAHRANVQSIADKFSSYYLPVVAGIALLTFLIRRDPLAAAAVLVVACSCSFALATPIAMLASIGAAAKRGVLIKGGKYLETLARADVLLVDKTGTLTLGKPQVTDVVSFNGLPQDELLMLAASAERYSEHPLAEAVRVLARERGVALLEPQGFESLPGLGVRAGVNGTPVAVGNLRLAGAVSVPVACADLEAEGKTLLWVTVNEGLAGVLAAQDTLRPEVPAALAAARSLGIRQVELLTGDNERTASALAKEIGVDFRANLLPEDKIRIVKEYQEKGHVVMMVGDGVNDAPALAQADVGVAMGAAGTDVAIEAAHIALMREDWTLVPEMLRIARRTMQVVKGNIGFTTVYNVLGLTLAAFGFLPPIFAAAAQSLPDLGILGNSSRLLKQR
jgi:Cd2+/Zn2+-exporting ATPase/Cu+-exporting ATPase